MITVSNECHYAEFHYDECHDLAIVMLNLFMLSLVMPSVIMLSVIMPNVMAPMQSSLFCFNISNDEKTNIRCQWHKTFFFITNATSE
jgi:hypothetical protein